MFNTNDTNDTNNTQDFDMMEDIDLNQNTEDTHYLGQVHTKLSQVMSQDIINKVTFIDTNDFAYCVDKDSLVFRKHTAHEERNGWDGVVEFPNPTKLLHVVRALFEIKSLEDLKDIVDALKFDELFDTSEI